MGRTNFFKGPKQNKPSKHKNFFQNYSDHLNWLEIDLQNNVKEVLRKNYRSPEISDVVLEGLLSLLDPKHLLILDALRDGYDYMDEFLGATVVPIAAVAGSIASTGLAIWEGAQALAIKAGMMKDDYEDHATHALTYLASAGAALCVAVASFVKSLISLVTRPIVTLAQGWKNDKTTTRFYNEDNSTDTKVEKAARGFDQFLNDLGI